MNWSKTPRILLVFPRRRRIKLSRLDLVLLQRHAASLGAQLGMVTRTASIRREAKKLGIPVFHSILDAERSPWETRPPVLLKKRQTPHAASRLRARRERLKSPPPAWTQSPAARLVFFTIGVLAVLFLAAAFLPRAEVTLQLKRQPQSLTLAARANPEISQVFLSGSIPARETSLVLETTRTVRASGETEIPIAAARGIARFQNLTTSPVIVPAGTVLRSLTFPPVRFSTIQEGEVPAGGSVDIPVRAIEYGVSGNLPADSLRIIEGELDFSLSVTNPAPITGGESKSAPAPVQEDYDRVEAVARAELDANALRALQAALPEGSVIFPQTVTLAQVVEKSFTPAESAPSEKLTIRLKAEYRAQYAAAEDLQELARRSLDVTLPDGFVPAPESLRVETLSPPLTQPDGTTAWQIRAARDLLPDVAPMQIIAWIQGRTPAQAEARLQNALPLASPPQVSVMPSFFPYLPLAPFRITIHFTP